MEKFNDSNLEGKIEPIVLWGIIAIICLFTVLIMVLVRKCVGNLFESVLWVI